MITKEQIKKMADVIIDTAEIISDYGVHILCKTIFSKYKNSNGLNLDRFCFPHNEIIDGDEYIVYHRSDLVFMLVAFEHKYKDKESSFDMISYHGDILDILTIEQAILFYEQTINIKEKV